MFSAPARKCVFVKSAKKRDPYPVKEPKPDAVPLVGVTRALPGDPMPDLNDVNAVFSRYYPYAWKLARQAIENDYIPNKSMGVADLTQEIVLYAFRHFKEYNPAKGTFATWLLWKARTVIGNLITTGKRHKRLRGTTRSLDTRRFTKRIARTADPKQLRPEYTEDVWDYAAKLLDERERLALELSVRDGLNNTQVGERMGCDHSRAYIFIEAARR
jgi:RNA polymerase sigma factor (sigma-70 family)